jgi:hypothetical protein
MIKFIIYTLLGFIMGTLFGQQIVMFMIKLLGWGIFI